MLGFQPSLSKSKQLYHLQFVGGKCELAQPDVKLVRYVDYYWLLTIEQPTLVLEVIPDTAIDLVLSPDIRDFAALYFPTDKKFDIDLEGPIQYAGMCFRSQTAPELLRMDFAKLRQLQVGADTGESLNVIPLMEDIQRADTISSIVERFDRFWVAQLEQLDCEPITGTGTGTRTRTRTRISHQTMIDVVEGTIGSGSIAGMCEIIGVSERQFRRLSKDLFGLSPKKLQRVLRLQAALDELFHSDARQIRDLYYDDSHRIKELKRLTGCTPSQIRKMAEKYNIL